MKRSDWRPVTYWLATPSRRGRTGFRSRTHMARLWSKQSRKGLRTLCNAEGSTGQMLYGPIRLSVEKAQEAAARYSKPLCKNCLRLAAREAEDESR